MTRPADLSPADEERLARYRAGAMPPAEREAFERDALADEALSEAIYREASFDALGGAAAPRGATITPLPPARMHGPGRRRALQAGARLAIAAGAAVVIGVTLWHARTRDSGPTPDVDAVRGVGSAVHVVEPAGPGDERPTRFTWTRDPQAESYRIEWLDAAGVPVTSRMTSDTTLVVESLGVALPESGSWRVVPIGADGLERTPSEAAPFGLPTR